MSQFQINILPFNILKQKTDFSFSLEKKDGYTQIYPQDLPKNFPAEKKTAIQEYVWWSVQQPEGNDIAVPVNLFENKRFAKHYFDKIIFDHFSSQNILTNRNFIRDTEIYIEDTTFNNHDYKKYHRFTLKVDNNDLIAGTSLLVSFDGDSYILNRSISAANLSEDNLGKVKFQNKIAKYKFLEDAEKADKANIFPILNRDIKRTLNIDTGRNYSENPYKKYFAVINQFYNEYLKDVEIGNSIKIFESGFYQPHEEKIKHTSDDSNLLLFGNNQKNFIPYIGLKEYGPIQPPPSDKPIKFIFIFHEDDKQLANKVYSYFKKGYKSFPGLESFVKIQFEIDIANSIKFKNKNPISEITEQLGKIPFDENTAYAAIYISRIKKDGQEEEIDEVYYKIKELLLKHRVTSQVIYSANIDNPSFNYFLPNIAIALLAKLGGIPWRLYRPIKNDLIVGIGADRSFVARQRYIGNSFCFKNDGSFKKFNVFESENTTALATSLKESIQDYISENTGCNRLVIHYYKKMSKKEEEPIRKTLNELNLSLPYIVVTINSTQSKDYVLFDDGFDGKMPQSGTFIKTKWNEFLLCNNTRYSQSTGTRIDGFPLPIKIKFKTFNYEKIDDMDVVRELLDQVYQFSRMYWKSVRQRNMPVTIEYSELVAEMIAHFENKTLEPFARNTLWFL